MQNHERAPFDLDKALSGHKLITRGGSLARAIDNSRKANDGRSLIVLAQKGDQESLRSYLPDGTCSVPTKALYLYKPVTRGWFNIYAGRKVGRTIYETETAAKNARLDGCVATIYMQWEEE